jgi:parallel beta-helix repeat protein
MRGSTALILAVASTAMSAGAAQAKTLTVDDDRAQCPSAGFTRVQAAVDAAAVNDLVRVCRGVYTEHVRIAPGKRGLKLRGSVTSPPRLVGPGDPGAYSDPTNIAVVDSRAAGVQILGFDIEGTVAEDDCVDVAGIGVYQGSASIDGVRIGPMSALCPGRGLGIKVGTGRPFVAPPVAKIDRTQISSFDGMGVLLARASVGEPHAPTVIQRTGIAGPGVGATTGSYGIYADRGTRFVARANTITDNAVGIFLTGQDAGTQVLGNHVTGNQRGIFAIRTEGPALIRSNAASRNTITGIELYLVGRLTVDRNVARDNGFYGIHLNSGRALIRGNTMRGNGFYDCVEEGTDPFSATRWSNNTGVTQNKPGLCRHP